MNARARWFAGFARVNQLLTALTFVLLGASFAFHVRGGADHRWADRGQLIVIASYFFLTPALAFAAWLTRDASTQRGLRDHWPLAVWLLCAIAASFIHF